MKICVKMELKKALCNRMAIFTLLLTILMVLLQAAERIRVVSYDYSMLQQISGNPQITSMSLYINWFGADVSSFVSSFFYFILPILVVLPYGWSLAGELRSGYTKNILCRIGRREYFISKYIAVFVSAMLIVLIPLILNVMLMALFLPALTPEVLYPYGSMLQRSVWSGVYYTHPFLYTCLNILLDAIYAGLIASLSTALACLLKKKIAVMVIPFFLLVIVDHLDNIFWDWDNSPLKFLRALPTANDRNGWVILWAAVAILVITFGVVSAKGEKYEVL